MGSKFLIDANSLITPYRRYYPFDLVPRFWSSMQEWVEDGDILIIDKVYDELSAGGDELSDWISNINSLNPISHKNSDIINKYSEILEYIRTSGLYKPKALTEWSDHKVADPWLIATAIVHKLGIITLETPNGNLSPSMQSAHPKIPDIAGIFRVECKTLIEAMGSIPAFV